MLIEAEIAKAQQTVREGRAVLEMAQADTVIAELGRTAALIGAEPNTSVLSEIPYVYEASRALRPRLRSTFCNNASSPDTVDCVALRLERIVISLVISCFSIEIVLVMTLCTLTGCNRGLSFPTNRESWSIILEAFVPASMILLT